MPTISKPIFVEPVDLGTMICGPTDTGHPVANLGRFKEIGLTWKATDDSAIWVRGRFDDAQAIDFCAIIAANAQPGTQFQLRLGAAMADVDPGGTPAYDSGVLDFIATTPRVEPDDGLYHSYLEINTPPVSATWWRIDISGHTGNFETSAFVMGTRVQPSHFPNLDFEYGEQDLGDINFTRFGVVDETPGLVWRTLDFTLAWASEDEYRASFAPMLRRLGKRGALYVCFDPSDTEDRQTKTYFGFLTKPAVAKGQRKPRTFSQEFAITSFI